MHYFRQATEAKTLYLCQGLQERMTPPTEPDGSRRNIVGIQSRRNFPWINLLPS